MKTIYPGLKLACSRDTAWQALAASGKELGCSRGVRGLGGWMPLLCWPLCACKSLLSGPTALPLPGAPPDPHTTPCVVQVHLCGFRFTPVPRGCLLDPRPHRCSPKTCVSLLCCNDRAVGLRTLRAPLKAGARPVSSTSDSQAQFIISIR